MEKILANSIREARPYLSPQRTVGPSLDNVVDLRKESKIHPKRAILHKPVEMPMKVEIKVDF